MENIALLQPKHKRRLSGKTIGLTAAKYIVLVCIALIILFPLFIMIAISILPDSEVNQNLIFSPTHTIYIGAYKQLLSLDSDYVRYLFNTLLICCIQLVSSLCAYGFTKIEFKGRDTLFAVVLSTMMIPGVVVLIPLYTIYVRFGWLDTLYPMFVPALFGGGATNIFLMKQFMRGVPNDLINAAKLDGANSLLIFFRMMIPMCVPIMLFVGVNSFLGAWGDFMTPYTYLSRESKWVTLSLGIYYEYGFNSSKYANAAMSAGVIMMIPCAVLFFVFQRFLIEGVALSGMKD